MKNNKKKISVVIVTYNSEKDIYDCIDSLYLYNDIGDSLEVIIVDNCSKHVEEMFAKLDKCYGDKVILLKNKYNGGYGYGNNMGIKKATAPIILIVNPDVRFLQPVFAKVVKSFSEVSELSMYGMKQMCSTNKAGLSFAWTYNSPAWIRYFGTVIGNKFDFYFKKKMYLSGACFFIRKLSFEQIGLFDENLFMYSEEDDIHSRLMIHNPRTEIIYNKHIKYLHLSNDRPINLKVLKMMLQSNMYLYRKFFLNEELLISREISKIRLILLINCLLHPFDYKKNDKYKKMNEWLGILKKYGPDICNNSNI